MAILITDNRSKITALNITLNSLRQSARERSRRLARKKLQSIYNLNKNSKSLIWLPILLICLLLISVSLFVLIYFNIIDPFNSPLYYEILYWFEDKIKILISLVIEEDITMPDDFDAEIAKLLGMIDEL